MEKTTGKSPCQKVMALVLAVVLAVTMIPAEGLTTKAYAAESLINMGVSQSGTLTKANEVNSYKFVMPASGQLSISGLVAKETSEAGGAYVALSICNQAGWEFSYWNMGVDSQLRLGKTVFLNKGEYILEIQQMAFSWPLRYNFMLSCTSANESFVEGTRGSNNTFDTANVIRANTTYRGQISADDRCDMYRISIPAKGNKRLIFNLIEKSDTVGLGEVKIYDSNRVEIKSWSYASGINGEVIGLTAGTYYISIGSSYGSGCYSYSFQLADPLPISKASVKLSQTKYTYTGRAIRPGVTVTYGGKRLVAGQDYTVSYGANKSAGAGKVTVTGLGSYAGSIAKTFTIQPAKPSVKSAKAVKAGFKITWRKKSSAEATGFQVQYSTSKSMKAAKTKTVKGTSKTIKGLKKGKSYYVRVRAYKTVGKTKVYSIWSAKTKVTTKKR